jgi:hypothetical protein
VEDYVIKRHTVDQYDPERWMKKIRYKSFMKEILNTSPDTTQLLTEVQEKKPKRGRPVGQFDYHKHVVLKYLQDYAKVQSRPFEGTNEDLAKAIGEWGEHFRVGVSPRQVARYLRKLQEETLPDDDKKPRVEISLHRFRHSSGGFGTRRTIVVNDLREFKVSSFDKVS